ncbi:MAG: pssA [Verrucomicrobiales bacterium]|nr:pssA [Verrucomicrobiales bacterium]
MNQDLPKIHFWPNLMTAGNLFCGFYAMLLLRHDPAPQEVYKAIWLILGACLFDMLDGRIARAVGEESPFGREFDSLADIVSFGVAPAFLMHQLVLDHMDNDRAGWFIAFAYLLCGAIRLARFNCVAATANGKPSKDFTGCPIPAAAGVICSVTLLLDDFTKKQIDLGMWKWCLPALLLLLSFLMVSTVKYPSFKGLSWRTKRTIPWFLAAVFVLSLVAYKYKVMPAVIFIGYLFYGLVRPWISRKWQREIEEDPDEPSDEDEEENRSGGGGSPPGTPRPAM